MPGDGPRPGLDLRLLLPALVAWAVTVALLPRPLWVVATVAAGSAGLTLALLRRAAATRAWDGPVQLLALTAAATCLVSTATGWHLARDTAGPVRGWAQEQAVVELTGRVSAEPRLISSSDEREPMVVLQLTLTEVRGRGQVSRPATPVLVLAPAGRGWEDLGWRAGLSATGRLGPPDPGQDVVAVVRALGPPRAVREPGGVLAAAEHVRARFREAVAPLPADARGLVPGLVVGDTSLTPADLTEAMRETGMTHLSAVSGSNVAIVLGAVALGVGAAGVPRRWRAPVTLLALVLFVLLCRPEPSVLRAGVMGAVGVLAFSASRRRVSLPALACAVLVLLCADPWLARSYGFALSTLATLGLVLFARPWGEAMASRLPRRLRLLAYATAVPLAAQVVCGPVIVLLQGSISTVAVVANLLAAPLVAPTTILGVVAAVLAPVSVPLAGLVVWAAAVPAWLLGQIARTGARMPWRTVEWVDGVPGAWLLVLLTLAAVLAGPWVLHQVLGRVWVGAGLLVAVLSLAVPLPGAGAWPPPGWVVVGCDVGQGDAFVVQTGGGALVVDAGPDPAPVARCLRDLGVDHVALLVLTHFHADHVAGLPGLLRTATVDRAVVTSVRDPPDMAEATLAALASAGVPVLTGRSGMVVQAGDAVVEVLAPGERPVDGGSPANNASVVLDVQAEGLRLLMVGDLEPEGAWPVRPLVAGRDYDVLKVAHHGSSAQDPGLVLGAHAEVAMIGVGADNNYGHPSPRALRLLAESGAVVLRTDTGGDTAVGRDDDGRLVATTRRGAGPAPP